jgi:hypothetical protein
VTWEQLAARLSRFAVTGETLEQYLAADSSTKLATKDCGWWVGGVFSPRERRKANLRYRSVLTLDLDHLDLFDEDAVVDALSGVAFLLHSSHSHRPEAPRLRLVAPLTRDVGPVEYEAVGRKVAEMVGLPFFDATGFQVSRIMFWPSRSADGEEYLHVGDGDWLDPDAVLAEYDDGQGGDWQDFGAWPTCPGEGPPRDPTKTAADPLSKPGVIGAFCRAFSVPEAIDVFDLPYVPSGGGSGRYSYTGGTSADGAIYYEEDGHLYSWHESDPARGNHNAWDLVRLHLYGHLDAGQTGVAVQDRESQHRMTSMALDMPEVLAELPERDRRGGAEDFDVLEVDDDVETGGGSPGEADGSAGTADGEPEGEPSGKPVSRALSVEQEWLDRIAAADTDRALRVDVAEGIRADTRLRDPLSREMLAQAWARRLSDLLGVKVGIGKAREALAPVRRLGSIEAPAWLKGWLYVQQEDVFFHVGSKTRLSTKAFNLTYAAEMHGLAERDDGLLGQTATHFATALVDVDKVARAMYMPRMGERFAINGETCVNLYDPSKLPATPSSEDLAADSDEGCRGRQAVAAVRRHLDWLLADDRERRLLLDWMAWQVQRPGELVRWAPLICGEEGDGKTALAELLQGVMGGENVRVLDTTQLSSAFTGWAHGQALIVCEEVYVPGHNRYEVVNRLKPYITNAVIEVHAKRHDPFNAPNTANYLLLTNHDDALPMEEGSRRYFALRTRFADPGELKAALSAEPGYFDTLFTAIREQRGALRRWLLDHEFSEEFVAARTAPATQQRQRMVALSRSDEELGIEDMLSAGVPYVTEAVLSTKHLADALRREGVQVRTRSLSKALSKARWVSLADVVGGDNRVRVDGHQLRVWVKKGELPVDRDVREWAADVLAASGLGKQFDDNMSENEQQQVEGR